MKWRLLVLVGALAFLPAAARSTPTSTSDWPGFGYDAARHNSAPTSTITARNVAKLKRLQVTLDGTVDSSPISWGAADASRRHDDLRPDRGARPDDRQGAVALHAAVVRAARRVGADHERVACRLDRPHAPSTRPHPMDGSGSCGCPTGKVLWRTAITRDPTHEKLTSSLNVSRGLVIVTTGGYIGDAPPYQGHVVTLAERTGRIAHVWNSLCSNRHALIVAAHVRVERLGDLVAERRRRRPVERNPRRGDRQWPVEREHRLGRQHARPLAGRGEAAPALDADGPGGSSTRRTLDLGSTSPGLLAGGYAVQGGKDGKVRLLQLAPPAAA